MLVHNDVLIELEAATVEVMIEAFLDELAILLDLSLLVDLIAFVQVLELEVTLEHSIYLFAV